MFYILIRFRLGLFPTVQFIMSQLGRNPQPYMESRDHKGFSTASGQLQHSLSQLNLHIQPCIYSTNSPILGTT